MDLLGNIWYNIFKNKYVFKENTRRRYLGNSTQLESGQYVPDDFTLPDVSELLPKEIPCHYCLNGKEECTMCVWNNTSIYPYGEDGSYTEAACPKCGGVGWVRCSFCFGNGKILVLE